MPRGSRSKVGTKFVSQNGYEYTKTETGWRATHLLVAEQKLGRPLVKGERIRFKDNDKRNLDPDNLVLTVMGAASKATRKARLEARIEELQAELAALSD